MTVKCQKEILSDHNKSSHQSSLYFVLTNSDLNNEQYNGSYKLQYCKQRGDVHDVCQDEIPRDIRHTEGEECSSVHDRDVVVIELSVAPRLSHCLTNEAAPTLSSEIAFLDSIVGNDKLSNKYPAYEHHDECCGADACRCYHTKNEVC